VLWVWFSMKGWTWLDMC